MLEVVEPHLVVLRCQHLDHILGARVHVNVDISERKVAFFTGNSQKVFHLECLSILGVTILLFGSSLWDLKAK